MTSWPVRKHGWWMRKMRRNHLIFKTVKNRDNWLTPAAMLALGISTKLHIFTEDTTMRSKTESSELSRNEDAAFQEWPGYNKLAYLNPRPKMIVDEALIQSVNSHWRLCPYVIIICLNLMSQTGKRCCVSAGPDTGVITIRMLYYSVSPHALISLHASRVPSCNSERSGATHENMFLTNQTLVSNIPSTLLFR